MNQDLTPDQKLTRCHLRIMRHPAFCFIGGILYVGKTTIDPSITTAYTTGIDTRYSHAWFEKLNEKQVNAIVLHENFHKAMRHLTNYTWLWDDDARLANIAADYVNNQTIQSLDPTNAFIEWPTDHPPLLDTRFAGMSLPEVFYILKKEQEQGGEEQGGEGQGEGHGGFDVHAPPKVGKGKEGDNPTNTNTNTLTQQELDTFNRIIDTALRQGAQLASNMKGGAKINVDGLVPVQIDYREVFRDFIETVCEGDEISTYAPPHRRSYALDEMLPSMFDENIGELVIAADTSGSMGSVYPILFSHIGAVVQQVKPVKTHILWWDTQVAKHQVFVEGEYDQIEKQMKPAGGGGTSPQCVVEFLKKKRIEPVAIIFLTDGYVDSWPGGLTCPVLWGMVGSTIKAPYGKSIYIHE